MMKELFESSLMLVLLAAGGATPAVAGMSSVFAEASHVADQRPQSMAPYSRRLALNHEQAGEHARQDSLQQAQQQRLDREQARQRQQLRMQQHSTPPDLQQRSQQNTLDNQQQQRRNELRLQQRGQQQMLRHQQRRQRRQP